MAGSRCWASIGSKPPGNQEGVKTGWLLCAGVCSMSNLSILHQIRQHDNHPTLFVVDHLPEVSGSGLHGALGNDEGSLLFVALERNIII